MKSSSYSHLPPEYFRNTPPAAALRSRAPVARASSGLLMVGGEVQPALFSWFQLGARSGQPVGACRERLGIAAKQIRVGKLALKSSDLVAQHLDPADQPVEVALCRAARPRRSRRRLPSGAGPWQRLGL